MCTSFVDSCTLQSLEIFFCGSRCSHSAQHSGLVKKLKTVSLFNCAPSDLTNSEFYHVQSKDRRALGKFPSLGPVRSCWALGFSSRSKKAELWSNIQRWSFSFQHWINLTQVPLHILAFFLCKALGYIITKQDYVRLSCYVEVTTGKHDTNTWY